jgi:hypothetical protein
MTRGAKGKGLPGEITLPVLNRQRNKNGVTDKLFRCKRCLPWPLALYSSLRVPCRLTFFAVRLVSTIAP